MRFAGLPSALAPSLKATLPAGEPLAGAFAYTVADKVMVVAVVTACGAAVRVVVLLPLATRCVSAADVEAAKFALPL
jgi:hypothetical protein